MHGDLFAAFLHSLKNLRGDQVAVYADYFDVEPTLFAVLMHVCISSEFLCFLRYPLKISHGITVKLRRCGFRRGKLTDEFH